MKFRGHAHRSLDDKGRLILPPEFRDAIRAELPDAVIVLTIFDKHVVGITPDQWSKLERELESIKSPSRALQNTIRLLNLGYTETPVGKQGRIAIPAHLRKSGKLDKEVVVIGAGRRLEIWSAEAFEDLLDQDYDVSSELAENNVSLPF
ncbi:division/cell wall cluster transcriptional repressor MraZ [Pseudodesulfovibrio methanolicus]|uniref:Transcriptional regulator MraZ n=1 Tax=Pseudodesulfovibrio methanolicus TaxID=3126690 RepID=A0ABZ2J5N1_9BACT